MAHILALKVTFNIDMKYSVHVWKSFSLKLVICSRTENNRKSIEMGGPFVFKYQSKDVTGKRVRYSTIKSSNQVSWITEPYNSSFESSDVLVHFCWLGHGCTNVPIPIEYCHFTS